MDFVSIIINKVNSGISIKEFLKNHHIGRGKVEELRINKSTFINDSFQPLDYILKDKDILKICFEEKRDFISEEKPLEIIYEDEYFLAVNKRAGIIIHPDDKNKTGTLVNAVSSYYEKNNINRKIRYLHRLDKDTTGIVLFAKDFYSEALLLKDIEDNKVKREYIGFCEGNIKELKGKINRNIGPDKYNSKKMCVCKSGKPSITKYEVIKNYKYYSEILFTLLTGRTHQIRVHASYIKHPILGDELYNKRSRLIKRAALHCYKMTFHHPILDKDIQLKCELPLDMKRLENE